MKFPVAFGGQPLRFCCVRKVCVACKDGPRGGTSGGAGSGGESLPVSGNIRYIFVSIRANVIHVLCESRRFERERKKSSQFDECYAQTEENISEYKFNRSLREI